MEVNIYGVALSLVKRFPEAKDSSYCKANRCADVEAVFEQGLVGLRL